MPEPDPIQAAFDAQFDAEQREFAGRFARGAGHAEVAAERTAGQPAHPAVTAEHLAAGLQEAEIWAEGGYSAESRAYWQGMRDTLRVVLGITTRPPTSSVDDAAATTLLRRG